MEPSGVRWRLVPLYRISLRQKMSRISMGHSYPRPCSASKTLTGKNSEETEKVILIDVDSKHFESIIFIDVPESLSKKSESPSMPMKNVIYIDDDEETPDSHHYVIGESESDSSECDNYPDCEFREDSSRKFQQQCIRKDTQNGTSRGINGDHNQKAEGETRQYKKGPFSFSTNKFKNTDETHSFGVKENAHLWCSNIFNDPDFDDFSLDSLVRAHLRDNKFDPPKKQSTKGSHFNEGKLRQDDSLSHRLRKECKDDHVHGPNGDDLPSVGSCIINEREMLKETDEYKRAIEEELASRKQALQIQAEEAQHLRLMLKRRKAESMRLLDMERRQKQRVEEMRITQKKDAENMNLKEVMRAKIIKDLKRLELSCHSLASLLHALGIHMGGWPNPSPQEVQTAYKRALLTFHPDRTSKTDIRQQVEAEEKFKLINRSKEKFAAFL
ncbi:hypothetical protein ACJIZ3_019397 [Penstemon smallii]|uniref:J domain-containing protein n=1 Tax=Penstemon smallii TaxID=265156 RepID=A0ABD3T1K5_9LAMI